MWLSLLLGAVNGYVSHRFQVPPLVVTLGMASLITGALLRVDQGRGDGQRAAASCRGSRRSAGTTFGIGIPRVVVIWAVRGGHYRRQPAAHDRRPAAVRDRRQPAAAELALVRTRRVWTATFALSGLLGGLLGVLVGGYTGSGNITLGDPYLFEGLAAVIVGGTASGRVATIGRPSWARSCSPC